MNRLITCTPNEEKHHGLTGQERTLVYKLALGTGLRWNEIYTLQRRDFIDLDIPADYPQGKVVLSIVLPEPQQSTASRFGDFLKTAPFDDDFIVERDKSLPRKFGFKS